MDGRSEAKAIPSARFRVTGSYVSCTRSYKGYWVVPTLSGRSMLFASPRWFKAVAYAILRNGKVKHREACRLVRRVTKDFRV